MGYRSNGMYLNIGELAACILLMVEVLEVDSLLVIGGIAAAHKSDHADKKGRRWVQEREVVVWQKK